MVHYIACLVAGLLKIYFQKRQVLNKTYELDTEHNRRWQRDRIGSVNSVLVKCFKTFFLWLFCLQAADACMLQAPTTTYYQRTIINLTKEHLIGETLR